jgi:hypothetical protein
MNDRASPPIAVGASDAGMVASIASRIWCAVVPRAPAASIARTVAMLDGAMATLPAETASCW